MPRTAERQCLALAKISGGAASSTGIQGYGRRWLNALVINMKTAKSLGLTIPAGVLAIADEVIE